jgi:hypothetical protein
VLVQVIKARAGTWYQKKLLETLDVVDTGHKTLYYLSKNQLKKMKKARHLQMGIIKEDCEVVDDIETDIEDYLKGVKE